MTGSNWPIRHVSVVAGVLLTLAIPSSAQAKPSDKSQTEQSGSPGGSADKDQKAEKSDKKDVDTEHLFGFTEGADAGEKGEQEVVIDTVTRVSKRRDGPGPSTYRVLDTRFAYQFNPIDKLSIEFSAFGTLRRQRNIVDLDDKSYGTFDGVSMEVKYQFLKGTKEQPLGLALEVRPRFTRILPVEGNGANIFDLESLLQLDVQVVPDKLWYGSNISFEPAAGRQRGGGPGYRSSTFLWSNVLVGRIGENTYFGPEVRYLRGYEGIFLNQLESEALTVGPALHHRFTEKIWLTAAYAGQVWGRDADPTLAGRALGLNQFERHNVRVKFGMEF
ncbi:hypothetical protein [Methylorubrum extorquens]|uniref:Transporter n=1 Tax=Methylorubrum extorquens TaxID=408 RepID=A0AAX3WI33_METEX|nr:MULTISPECIES: hypothetical protein [Methylobacteriaceae]KQO88823.1 hypothetical protein ASF33_21795 [Methylobacterium sp. Leaf92]KQQ21276.1 hypothetical protein ASF56_19255 [Methylobacterium sp. Leaf122]WHQ71203.1 hypothetical protein KEC54_06415 [Methylorubrum extorquens]